METKIINSEETNITENTASVLTLAAECNSTSCDTCNNSNCDCECNCNCDGATTGGTCGEETTTVPSFVKNPETIFCGVTKSVCACCPSDYKWFKFVPEVTANYAVISSGCTSVAGRIYKSDGSDSEKSIGDPNFIIKANL